MDLLFLTMTNIRDIEAHGIYTDLMPSWTCSSDARQESSFGRRTNCSCGTVKDR